MKSLFCIVPLVLLQFIHLTWALPWDLPTCPLPAPPPPPAQHALSPDVGVGGGSTGKRTDLAATKIINLLLPRQTICQRVTCNSQYYCCNDQTCSYQTTKWVCLWPTRTVTFTSTYQSKTTSISTTTRSFTSTTWDTTTTRIFISSTGTWTTTVTVTDTVTETSFTTSSVTLKRRDMPTPTPTRCVHRPEEEKRRISGLAKRQDYTYYVTTTIVVTVTPASTYYLTTTWLYTYWITGTTTTTRTSIVSVDHTVTSTYLTTTTTTSTITMTTKPPGPTMSTEAKVGAGVGGGVGGLAVIALIIILIWKKRSKPTAEEVWAGNQPVEDKKAPPGGAGGVVLAAGATYKDPYKAGYYDQDGKVVTSTPSSPQPAPPPAAYFQPVQRPQGYPELGPNDTGIHTIPRRPIPGSPVPPPSYRG